MDWTGESDSELSGDEWVMLEIGWLDLWFAYRDEVRVGEGDDG